MNIYFVTPVLSSIIRNDIACFEEADCTVFVNRYKWKKKSLTPLFMIMQFFSLTYRIKGIHIIYIQFAGYWAFIPALLGRLFNKEVYIVLNGTGCAAISSLGYGNLRKEKTLLRYCIYKSYNWASKLLPVSESLIYTDNYYYSDNNERFQGLKAHFSDIRTEIKVIANGLEVDFWRQSPEVQKEPNTFIAVFSKSQFLLKGGDLILDVANHFPNCKFFIAGMSGDSVKEDIPPNVFFLGRLTRKELRHYYRKCSFHFQLSVFEGFGMALCEAMLCECIPIGSSVNVIPEIIGDTGWILDKRDLNELKVLLEKINKVEINPAQGKRARSRILNKYALSNRKGKLLNLIGKSEILKPI